MNSDFNVDNMLKYEGSISENMEENNNEMNTDAVCDDVIYSMKLCSNCLNAFDVKNEECFENDECGHILCLKCRFVQGTVCRLCTNKQQEELNSSVALDLTTNYSSYSDNLKPGNSTDGNNSSNSGVVKCKKKVKIFVLPKCVSLISSK